MWYTEDLTNARSRRMMWRKQVRYLEAAGEMSCTSAKGFSFTRVRSPDKLIINKNIIIIFMVNKEDLPLYTA